MITERLYSNVFLERLARVRPFVELLKVRLSLLVAFSCAFGYALAVQGSIDKSALFMIIIGAFLLSGASVCINQIIERDVDKLMKRTQDRPLPTGRVTVEEALVFSILCFIAAVWVLWNFTNPITVYLAILSSFLYAFVYTPLKKIGPFAVFVGAIPGALPPLLGWVAATGQVTHEALIIFGIQFIWQFPHFWAIAWVSDDDYQKAGFKLLPSKGGKNLNTAVQIMIYTLFLIPLGLLPAKFGITGINSAIAVVLIGIAFFVQTFSLMKTGSQKAAFRIMMSSFLYLPLVWISFLLDKIN